MMKITTRKFKMGDVFLLKDQTPTTSSGIIRHNYIIVSEPARESDRIMVIGISSCRNGVFKELIPFEASNGDNSYIDTNRVYLYPIGEIMRGCYHGCVEQPIAEKLHDLIGMKLGFIPVTNGGEIRTLLDELGAVNLINGTQVPLDKIDDVVADQDISVETEAVEEPAHDIEETVEDNIDKPSASIYPKTIHKWPLWSLLKVSTQFKAGKTDEIERDCNVHTRSGLLYKEQTVNKEINTRVGSVFSSSVLTAKRKPEFWKITDMVLFISRYEGGDESRETLLESLSLTKSQADTIYTSCTHNINVYINKKGAR
jgi:hypothetical protein